MMVIIEFDQSLKLTWVRKMLVGHYEWSVFDRENKNLMQCGICLQNMVHSSQGKGDS